VTGGPAREFGPATAAERLWGRGHDRQPEALGPLDGVGGDRLRGEPDRAELLGGPERGLVGAVGRALAGGVAVSDQGEGAERLALP